MCDLTEISNTDLECGRPSNCATSCPHPSSYAKDPTSFESLCLSPSLLWHTLSLLFHHPSKKRLYHTHTFINGRRTCNAPSHPHKKEKILLRASKASISTRIQESNSRFLLTGTEHLRCCIEWTQINLNSTGGVGPTWAHYYIFSGHFSTWTSFWPRWRRLYRKCQTAPSCMPSVSYIYHPHRASPSNDQC